jgi:MFS family permease
MAERLTLPETAPPTRRRTRRLALRWVVIGIITLLTITNYLDRGNLSVAAPLIRKDLHISGTQMGLVLSAFVWPYAVMNLPAGWLVDRFGPRIVMAAAGLLWSVAGAVTGLARNVGVFLGLRALLGVAEAPMFPAALKAATEWFPERERARAVSVYIAATQVGLALAPPIATALIVGFGWQAMFVLMGLMGLVAVLAWWAVYRRPERQRWISESELDYIRSGQSDDSRRAERGSVSGREWFGLFAYSQTWTMMVGAFCLQYVFWFYITWLPSYLESAQHFTLNKAGLLAALPYVAGGVAVLLGGRFADLLVDRGVAPLHARRWTMAGGALLTAMALAATAGSTSPGLAVTLLTVGMFTYSLCSGPYWTLGNDVVRSPRLCGSVSSIQNFGGFLGGACAPVVTGFLVDRAGGFVPALLTAAGLALVSAALYGLVLRRRMPV